MSEEENELFESIVHRLRSNGWPRIEAEGEALARIVNRRIVPSVNSYDRALMDMAVAYGLGTPESRAIVTAMDHARANATDRSGEAGETGTGLSA